MRQVDARPSGALSQPSKAAVRSSCTLRWVGAASTAMPVIVDPRLQGQDDVAGTMPGVASASHALGQRRSVVWQQQPRAVEPAMAWKAAQGIVGQARQRTRRRRRDGIDGAVGRQAAMRHASNVPRQRRRRIAAIGIGAGQRCGPVASRRYAGRSLPWRAPCRTGGDVQEWATVRPDTGKNRVTGANHTEWWSPVLQACSGGGQPRPHRPGRHFPPEDGRVRSSMAAGRRQPTLGSRRGRESLRLPAENARLMMRHRPARAGLKHGQADSRTGSWTARRPAAPPCDGCVSRRPSPACSRPSISPGIGGRGSGRTGPQGRPDDLLRRLAGNHLPCIGGWPRRRGKPARPGQ